MEQFDRFIHRSYYVQLNIQTGAPKLSGMWAEWTPELRLPQQLQELYK